MSWYHSKGQVAPSEFYEVGLEAGKDTMLVRETSRLINLFGNGMLRRDDFFRLFRLIPLFRLFRLFRRPSSICCLQHHGSLPSSGCDSIVLPLSFVATSKTFSCLLAATL